MIEFQTQNVEMPQIDVELVRTWIGEVAARHGKTVGPLTYCFCDDVVSCSPLVLWISNGLSLQWLEEKFHFPSQRLKAGHGSENAES